MSPKFKSFKRNCYVVARDEAPIFMVTSDSSGEEVVLAALDGYAIIPKEVYDDMRTPFIPEGLEGAKEYNDIDFALYAYAMGGEDPLIEALHERLLKSARALGQHGSDVHYEYGDEEDAKYENMT